VIITMRKQANILMVEHVATTFQRAGYDVLIRNGEGKTMIAVLGQGYVAPFTLDRLAGVEKIDRNNDLFNSTNGEGFTEAYEFFAKYESRKAGYLVSSILMLTIYNYLI